VSAAHTPDEEAAAALIVADHEANGEDVIDPRERRIDGVGSRRPIDGRLHIATKRMAAGKCRVKLCRVNQALRLLDRGEPPPKTASRS
jgi:hypothetical protein